MSSTSGQGIPDTFPPRTTTSRPPPGSGGGSTSNTDVKDAVPPRTSTAAHARWCCFMSEREERIKREPVDISREQKVCNRIEERKKKKEIREGNRPKRAWRIKNRGYCGGEFVKKILLWVCNQAADIFAKEGLTRDNDLLEIAEGPLEGDASERRVQL
ncbi:Uncharacterized protein TCM_006046 [Theobroma cacao]|uniref:Uncharacterized protein n=1 Tax=Theobroma cacao TaxID=3641 RepID=A0A061DVS6_THECC|nr:Uncharacterized protein TCM_006046 [Theobroma cacao]